jgi:hypothetical protein
METYPFGYDYWSNLQLFFGGYLLLLIILWNRKQYLAVELNSDLDAYRVKQMFHSLVVGVLVVLIYLGMWMSVWLNFFHPPK